MVRAAILVVLTDEDRATLKSRVRATTTEQRLVLRAKIIMAAAGQEIQAIAESLGLRQAIDEFIEMHNAKAAPFEWKKAVVHPIAFASSYAKLHK